MVLTLRGNIDDRLYAEATRAGAQVEAIEGFVKPDRLHAIRREATQKVLRFKEYCTSAEWDGFCAAHQIDAQAAGEVMQTDMASRLADAMFITEGLDEAAKRFRIDLVVVNEDLQRNPRTVVEWARARNVPSLHVSHSVGLFSPYTVHRAIHADVLALFGERGGEGMREIDIPPERTRLTGCPAWDVFKGLSARRREIRKALAQQHGLDPDRPIVVFGTTWVANLTAFCDPTACESTLDAFVLACDALWKRGVDVQPVIKERPQNMGFATDLLARLAVRRSIAADRFLLAFDGLTEWLAACDAVVSVDSNISIEAMLARTPAVNLLNDVGQLLGPPFESGVVAEVDATGLPDALQRILTDADYRKALLDKAETVVGKFNVVGGGTATERVVRLMEEMAGHSARRQRYPWQTLLDVENSDASQYHNWARTQLFPLFGHPPRCLLDIGCGAGATGKAVKDAYPEATVFGVEVNRAAVEVARTRIDRVMLGKFEEVDLEAEGVQPGSIDTVIVADVLEHMYDPWGVLVRLRPYLTADAQIIASIPNIRNLVVMEELAKGNWRYEEWGLLDVTHIRFFTLREIRRFFHETGYRVTQTTFNIDPRLAEYYNRHQGKPAFNVEFERMTLKNVNADEFSELCSLQFFVRAEPGAVADPDLDQAVREKSSDYAIWRMARELNAGEGASWDAHVASWPRHPRVHLALLVAPGCGDRIEVTLRSLTAQYYDKSIITIVASVPPAAGWQDGERLRWRVAADALLAEAGRALIAEPADWVGIIDAGDRLEPRALLFMVEAAVRNGGWQMVYSDEDVITGSGEYESAQFKPDFNIDLLRAYPYVGGQLLVDHALFVRLGGFDTSLPGIEEHDLVLRASELLPPDAIGHVADVMLHRLAGGGHGANAPEALYASAGRALQGHLARQGLVVEVANGFLPLSWQLRYRGREQAKVSIVIVVRDHLVEFQRALESIFKFGGDAFSELLVLDAGSADPECRAFIEGLEGLGDARLCVYRVEPQASYAAYCNLMAGEAGGDYLLFLHFDATPLASDWLATLMGHAGRPEIGVVAPRLLAADGSVRRTGMILGLGGGTETAFSGIRFDDPGYFGRALVEQNVSAVAGGAFLTRASVFRKLGGFDDSLGVDAAEVDYCLRVADLGLRVLWTPHASFLCAGAAEGVVWSGEASPSLDEALSPRWLDRLAADPAYNRNLSRISGAAFSVECRTVLNWDPLPWKPLPRVLAHPADNVGCGNYRIFGPARALIEAGRVQGWVTPYLFGPLDVAPLALDAIVFQRQTTDEQIASLERHRRYTKTLKVFELDDLLIQLPGRSVHRTHLAADIVDRLRRAVPLCDRLVVSTEPLAEAYRGLSDDIRVAPNYVERSRWGHLRPLRRQAAKPRVGWIGGIGHSGDLEMIADVVRELAAEVDWVFMGMCPEALRPYVGEYHDGLPFEKYPAKVASLNLDLALAPLEINPFNEGKSNLRLLEYGALGYPVVCSDIFPYQCDLPVTRVRNRTNDWVRAIREHIADLDATAAMGDALRAAVEREWMLEDHLDDWLRAWLP